MYKKGTVVKVIKDFKFKSLVGDVQLTKNKNYTIVDNLNSKTISSSHPLIIIDDLGNKVQLKYIDVISLKEIRENKIKSLIKKVTK